jgi:GNAT superfamily N-acetyltransferase
MPKLSISTVQDDKDLLAFITFPWEVYRRDPYWVPPLISERLEFLDRERNPFFQHGSASYFLARRNGQVVGTIAAFTNRLYNEVQGVNTGFFGFFEVLPDPEAAEALLATAEAWCREAGHGSVVGPAQFSTNDELGLLVDGFADAPRILMTYNPPRYQQYLESAGYQKAMDLLAYRLGIRDFEKNIPEKLVRVAEKVAKRGKLRVRRVNMSRFDEEVGHVKRIYNRSWEKNWGFVPMTEPEFDRLARNLKTLIDPDLIVAVEAGDEVVGFGLTLPDLSQPLRLAYPRPGVPEALTLAKLMWHWKVRRKVDWLRIIALGVLPEYQGMGVDALMYLETARAAFPKGYKMAELSWILETNEKMNRPIVALGGEVYKRYRMYEKTL